MATCTIKEVIPVPPPIVYTIGLSQTEAASLQRLLHAGVGSESLEKLELTSLLSVLTYNMPKEHKFHFHFVDCARLE